MANDRELEAYYFHEKEWDSYEALYEAFEWEIPDRFNIATYVCDRWADDKGKIAVFSESADGTGEVHTYWQLKRYTDKLANVLEDSDVGRGDFVGVNVGQKFENLVAQIAAWKLGAIAVPLTTLFGPDGLEYRLGDCGATTCVVDETNLDSLRSADLPDLENVFVVGDVQVEPDERSFWDEIHAADGDFETVRTSPEDDAYLIYTSGTTGDPKGVRHGHGVLLGSLTPYLTMNCNLEIRTADIHWNVAEWTWVGSLFVSVLPPLFYGTPIVAYDKDGPFDAETALTLIEKYEISNFFAPPTALRQMKQQEVAQYDIDTVRLILSGGEDVGQNLVDWAVEVFDGAVVHEGYGLSEAMGVIADCRAVLEFREGRIGKPTPGHAVTLLDPETGEETVGTDEVGEFAIAYEGDPLVMKEYWNRPEETNSAMVDGWLLTNDLGTIDEDGYMSFVGRKDDVIISAGYRIGPEEVEDTLASHDAVMNAGVIGIPDEERGEVPKAFLVLSEGYEPSEDLTEELIDDVKQRLAKYEYPREIEFIEELPLTPTGKISRSDLRDRSGLDD